jgi:hypothetical protein
MRASLLTNLFVTLALVIYLLRSQRFRTPIPRARTFYLGFISAFVALVCGLCSRGSGRWPMIASGTILGLVSLLNGTLSINVS